MAKAPVTHPQVHDQHWFLGRKGHHRVDGPAYIDMTPPLFPDGGAAIERWKEGRFQRSVFNSVVKNRRGT